MICTQKPNTSAPANTVITVTDLKFKSQPTLLNDYVTDELFLTKKIDQVTSKKIFSELGESELLMGQKGHFQTIENKMRRCMAYAALTNHR